jgi:hypothetical protein
MSSTKVWNWGIIGTGRIASDFLGALKTVSSAQNWFRIFWLPHFLHVCIFLAQCDILWSFYRDYSILRILINQKVMLL